MIDMLYKMKDFYLFNLNLLWRSSFGFGKTYNLGGENFEVFFRKNKSSNTRHGEK